MQQSSGNLFSCCCLVVILSSVIVVVPAIGSSLTKTPRTPYSSMEKLDFNTTATLHNKSRNNITTSAASSTATTDVGVTASQAYLACEVKEFYYEGKCVACACKGRKACHPVTGECPNGCARRAYGKACRFGIVSLHNEKANPGQATNVTCVVRLDSNDTNVYLTTNREGGKLMPINSTLRDNGATAFKFFLERGLYPEDSYTCNIPTTNGHIVSKMSKPHLYIRPQVTHAPVINFNNSPILHIKLRQWNQEFGDIGDGPIESYLLQACRVTEQVNCSRLGGEHFTIIRSVPNFEREWWHEPLTRDFKPAGTYKFVYRAQRPDYNGFGPPSPVLEHKMPCKKPAKSPLIDPQVKMALLSKEKCVAVTISWRLPYGDAVACDCIVSVKAVFVGSGTVENIILSGNTTSTTQKLLPNVRYVVLLSFTNNGNFSSATSALTLEKTPPAPPSSPAISRAYLLNKKKARIEWLPSNESFSDFLTYEVSHSLYSADGKDTKYVEGCKREKELWVTGEMLWCDLTLKQLEKTYNFVVRAKNTAGYGDNSSVLRFHATATVPDPVLGFTNLSRTDNSIQLEWKEPQNTGGIGVVCYKLECKGKNHEVNSTITLNEPQAVIKYNVTGLLHSNLYSCRVAACNDLGCSAEKPKEISVYTKPKAPIYPPPVPVIKESKITDTTLTVNLSPSPSSELYQVIVEPSGHLRSSRVKRGVTSLKSCMKCFLSGDIPSCYVAAQLTKEELPVEFVVGDNTSYRGYCNPPLLTGEEYQIWFGAGNEVDGEISYNFIPAEKSFIAKAYVVEKKAGLSDAVLAGVICSVLLALALVILLLCVVLRQRRHKMFEFRTPDREKVMELRDNGTLIDNGYVYHVMAKKSLWRSLFCGTGDSLSDQSLDLSKQPNGEPVYDNVKLKHYPVLLEELHEYIDQKSEDDGFKKEYNLIPWGLKYPHEVAKHQDNKLKNRYGNIIAYDHSRVVLKDKNPDQDTDYINANYIDGYTTPREYIATQGPTKLTVNDFWHMAWQERTSAIVMVTNTIELTRHKCEQYWPEEGSIQCDDIKVTMNQLKSLAYYKIRVFTLEKDSESRTIRQFHFTAWPDHGTPKHATTLLSFLKKVRRHKDPNSGPIICHCSAGVGRSGTFIALDSLLQQAKMEGRVDVYGFVSQMRKQRCNMIQTLDQYVFLHDAILEATQGFDTIISLSEFKSMYASLLSKTLTQKDKITTQFEKLQQLLFVDTTTDATSDENIGKNRDVNVIPFNMRRVRLQNMPSDYINATYVDDHRKRSSMVAAQHPLPSTIEDFWKMVQSEKPVAIATLCGQNVGDNEEQNLPKFWPGCVNEVLDFTSVSVKLISEEPMELAPSITVQHLMVNGKSQLFQMPPVEVTHYVCTFWDSSKPLPNDPDSFMTLLVAMEQRKVETKNERSLLINCGDGAKQTGLYMASHLLLQQILMDDEVDIPETVKLIRNDQPCFIPCLEQYQYLFEFVSEYTQRYEQDSSVSDTCNIDTTDIKLVK